MWKTKSNLKKKKKLCGRQKNKKKKLCGRQKSNFKKKTMWKTKQ